MGRRGAPPATSAPVNDSTSGMRARAGAPRARRRAVLRRRPGPRSRPSSARAARASGVPTSASASEQRQPRLDGHAEQVEQRGQVAPDLGDALRRRRASHRSGAKKPERGRERRGEQREPAGEQRPAQQAERGARQRSAHLGREQVPRSDPAGRPASAIRRSRSAVPAVARGSRRRPLAEERERRVSCAAGAAGSRRRRPPPRPRPRTRAPRRSHPHASQPPDQDGGDDLEAQREHRRARRSARSRRARPRAPGWPARPARRRPAAARPPRGP